MGDFNGRSTCKAEFATLLSHTSISSKKKGLSMRTLYKGVTQQCQETSSTAREALCKYNSAFELQIPSVISQRV
ncbi:hypothetical protein HZ326_6055 [Fusarium oxysporum f. sp. albedinis]|nr:hypothetical protein HZ326_6055 [Fusarium oxysporum f. sp. albedinis]